MCIFHQLSDKHQQTIREIFNVYPSTALSWSAILNLLDAITKVCEGWVLDPTNDRVCVAIYFGQEYRIGIFPRRGDCQFADSSTIRDIRSYLETIDVQPDE
ncbi:hypothetical protein IFO70_23830 [Phormidium tenue FACHB-886]|nr:hypothetical protein [Phormidium tenue FACHB-886]